MTCFSAFRSSAFCFRLSAFRCAPAGCRRTGPALLDKLAEYGVSGDTKSVSGKPAPTHQFVDHEPDPATGYYYFGARVYDPTLKRWLSPDPLIFGGPQIDAGEGQELNLYAYAKNNPANHIDPNGTCSGWYCHPETMAWPGKSEEVGPGSFATVSKSGVDALQGAGTYLSLTPGLDGVGDLMLGAAELAEFTASPNTASFFDLGMAGAGMAAPIVGTPLLKAFVNKVGDKMVDVLGASTKDEIAEGLLNAEKVREGQRGPIMKKTGGEAAARKDFERLAEGSEVKKLETGKGKNRFTVPDKDGRGKKEFILRGDSSGGTTLEIQQKNPAGKFEKTTKIRYE